MKYQIIDKIYNKISTIKNVSLKVQITLLKNKNLLREHFDLIQEVKSRTFSEEYLEYHSELKSLYEKYCEKISENSYLPKKETKHEFDKDVYYLNEKYSEIIKKYTENEIIFNEFLQEDVKISFYKYSLEDLPDDLDGLLEDEIDVLFKFINN